jgi:hypothetical protein
MVTKYIDATEEVAFGEEKTRDLDNQKPLFKSQSTVLFNSKMDPF